MRDQLDKDNGWMYTPKINSYCKKMALGGKSQVRSLYQIKTSEPRLAKQGSVDRQTSSNSKNYRSAGKM